MGNLAPSLFSEVYSRSVLYIQQALKSKVYRSIAPQDTGDCQLHHHRRGQPELDRKHTTAAAAAAMGNKCSGGRSKNKDAHDDGYTSNTARGLPPTELEILKKMEMAKVLEAEKVVRKVCVRESERAREILFAMTDYA